MCIVILGPTATGKTRLGVQLARRFNGEIISADSRQFYRGMDIGTGKDLAEYGTGSAAVPYHLIDIVEPEEEYNLHRFVRDARNAIADITRRGRLPIVVGGTSLYLHALLERYEVPGGAPDPVFRKTLEGMSSEDLAAQLQELDPALYARTDLSQRRRIVRALEIAVSKRPTTSSEAEPGEELRLKPLLMGPYFPRHEVHARIAERLRARLAAGLLEEVQSLHARGVSWERLEFFGLEYRYVSLYLQKRISRTELEQTLLARIRRFCKAQDIWFRKMEREGWVIHWLPQGNAGIAADLAERFLAGQALPPPEVRLNDILYGPRSQ
jgi:tRNA dimethylallyltransferase